MNHVPDEAITAIDALGEGVLVGAAPVVDERLRSDLRFRVDDVGPRTARCVFYTDHTQHPPTLRDRGSYVTTILDNVDQRLRSWGIDPPPAYEYVDTTDETHQYEGTLSLP